MTPDHAIALQAQRRIIFIRSQKVKLDSDLAELYGVETKVLNQAVRRNRERFPDDFMFQLTDEEVAALRFPIGNSNTDPNSAQSVISSGNRSQIVTGSEAESSRSQIVTLKRGQNIKYRPHAFTEQGVAMLSSVLRSDRAVQVNIAIMRAFVRLRELLATNADLARKLEAMEKKYDGQFKIVFDAIRQLMTPPAPPPPPPRKEIGFGAITQQKGGAAGRIRSVCAKR